MSDKAFRAWIQTLPSALSGGYSEYVSGEGRNPACHVRRAATSGTGYKGEYCCIPLTHDEHRLQHQHGETALAPKAWWDAQVEEYRRRWRRRNMKL